jgi:hypothetical protein
MDVFPTAPSPTTTHFSATWSASCALIDRVAETPANPIQSRPAVARVPRRARAFASTVARSRVSRASLARARRRVDASRCVARAVVRSARRDDATRRDDARRDDARATRAATNAR